MKNLHVILRVIVWPSQNVMTFGIRNRITSELVGTPLFCRDEECGIMMTFFKIFCT